MPAYGWDGDSETYMPVPPGTPLETGHGYWVFFDVPTVVEIHKNCRTEPSLPERCLLPALSIDIPGGEMVLVGNPDPVPVTVAGADAVYTYDPSTATYHSGATIELGQGAWVYSASGGALTFTSVFP